MRELDGNEKERIVFTASMSVAGLISKTTMEGDCLLLVQKKGSGKWTLPSGGVKRVADGRVETPVEAFSREVLEEAGIDLKARNFKPKLRGVVSMKHPTKDKFSLGVIYTLALDYNCDLLSLAPQDDEISQVKLFNFSELQTLLEDSETNLYRPDLNDGLIRWWVRNWWTHDNLDDIAHNDGEITSDLILRLSREKAWY